MRKTVAIGAGATIAAVLTHGFVYSGSNLNGWLPPRTYHGIFQNVIQSAWDLWNYVHGWPSGQNHAYEFGRQFFGFVIFGCPMLAFGVFALAARLRLGWRWWRPVTVAVAMTVPAMAFYNPLRTLGLDQASAETVRALVVYALMVWSAGALPSPKIHGSQQAQQSAAA